MVSLISLAGTLTENNKTKVSDDKSSEPETRLVGNICLINMA